MNLIIFYNNGEYNTFHNITPISEISPYNNLHFINQYGVELYFYYNQIAGYAIDDNRKEED